MVQRRRKKLGEILIAQGYITEDQLNHGMQEHRRTGISLGTVLVRLGFISEGDLTSVLGEQIQLSQRRRIGEVLIEQGLVTPPQLEQGLSMQKQTGERLGSCLVKLRFITEEKLIDVLSAQLDVPHVVLENFNFDRRLVRVIPEDLARKYKVIPLFERDGVITVAMADPTNLRTIDHLKFKTGREIEPVIASEKSITRVIERQFSTELEEMSALLGTVPDADVDVVRNEDPLPSQGQGAATDEEGAQVIKIVNIIVARAISDRASDIHLEPLDRYLRLRYRVDGQLLEKNPIPLQLQNQIISRLKILAGMDIAEKRRPQDGRFQIRHEGREIDLRVSTFPSLSRNRGVNEKIVMRILDPEANCLTLDDLGFLPAMRSRFEQAIAKPNGIILVTGPTGSGKSSTLYAALQRIYTVEKNIVTMEDPVEMNIDGITQGQIAPKSGFTFADGMRSILRQDPDIIMIGEMRDLETSEMAIQAALTGHLVFSTLHTNDSPSAFTRMMDMGLEPYLITSTIIGILAQRLVRGLCQRCKEPYDPEPPLLTDLGLKPGITLYRAKGCPQCNNTGYRGRIGLFEWLEPDDTIRSMVMRREAASSIAAHAFKSGSFDTLRRDGLRKAVEGRTTVEQVMGATRND